MSFPGTGVTLSAPKNWIAVGGRPPLVAMVTSGDAVVALWRYVRARPLPKGPARMSAAVRAVIGALRGRQPDAEVIRARIVHLRGIRGIEVDAIERINGRRRQVRSTHLYTHHEEIVLEEYAPPPEFDSVDRAVFSPLRRSLRIVIAS